MALNNVQKHVLEEHYDATVKLSFKFFDSNFHHSIILTCETCVWIFVSNLKGRLAAPKKIMPQATIITTRRDKKTICALITDPQRSQF